MRSDKKKFKLGGSSFSYDFRKEYPGLYTRLKVIKIQWFGQLLYHFENCNILHQESVYCWDIRKTMCEHQIFFSQTFSRDSLLPFAEKMLVPTENFKKTTLQSIEYKAQHNRFRIIQLTLRICHKVLLISYQLKTCGVTLFIRCTKVSTLYISRRVRLQQDSSKASSY